MPFWNIFDANKYDCDKTNNICEGFNDGFSHSLSDHMCIYKCINGLKKQQDLIEIKIVKSTIGDPNVPRKK